MNASSGQSGTARETMRAGLVALLAVGGVPSFCYFAGRTVLDPQAANAFALAASLLFVPITLYVVYRGAVGAE